MPAYYSKPQIELLLQLINEANPGLLEMRDLVNSRIGVPQVYAPQAGEIADTSLELYATPQSFYIGKRIVYYRRINIAKLFANMQLDIDRWQPGNLPQADMIALLNQRHGLSLVGSDITASSIGEGSSWVYGSGSSLVYSADRFLVRWTKGKRAIDQILTKDSYAGLYWDANFVEGKPLMNLVGLNIDFSRFAAMKTLPNGHSITTLSSDVRAMADWFSGYTGLTLDPRIPHAQVGGIGGLTVTRFTLPNSNLPEANPAKFNRALVIAPTGSSWFAGKIIWHYNE
ncbi:hypothetical protein D3C78_728850 [compost metagenome]